MNRRATVATIQIRSPLPLIHAGLERAAKAAGFEVVSSDRTTTLTVPSDHGVPSQSPVDICLGEHAVVATVTEPLGATGWAALGRFVDQLVPLPNPLPDQP